MAPALPPSASSRLSAAIRSSVIRAEAACASASTSVVVEAPGYDGQRVDQRAQAGGAADPERTRKARRVPVLQLPAQMAERGERKLGGRRVLGHRRMRRQENRDPGYAVVEIRPERRELEDLGIPHPVEADPCSGPAPANGMLGYLGRDPIGFRGESRAGGHRDVRFQQRTRMRPREFEGFDRAWYWPE